MVNRLLKLFTAETYWKERLLGILAFAVYGIGNLIEQFSGKVTSDPPVIWITGIVISVSLIWISLSKYRRYTSYLFKLLILFGNFNMVFAYGESTKGSVESESLYLLFSYAIFIVSSQVLDSRRELILMTLFETMYFAIAVYINRGENPLLLSPFQLLMFLFVMGGNFLIGLQRLRLTQVTGGSTIQFRMLSENARDVQSIINPQFNFMYVNPSVKQLSGFGLNDLNGKNFLTLVVDQDKAQVQQVLTQLSENPDKKQNVEYRIKGKDSTEVWVESIFSLFKPDPNLPAEFIFSETRDIEARKKLEEEIQKQLRVEEMLIKFSNRFINMERMEIQQGINVALGEFGKMLQSDGVLIYRTQEQPQGEFRSTNQWFAEGNEVLNEIFNLSVHINQPLIIFLRSMGGTKSSHGDYVEAAKLNEIGITTLNKFSQKTFYIIPLQSGNVVNGFVVFVFDQNTGHAQSSFFGLIGNRFKE